MSNRDEFKTLLTNTGLSLKGLADLLNEKYETVKNWSMGRTAIPLSVMDKLKEHEKNVKKVFD